jgi:membrane-associated protein
MDFILHIDKYLANLISRYHALSYLILFAFIFAETGFVITPFIPGDSLLFAAGALIAGGHTGLNIYLLAGVLVAAAFTGNSLNYTLGYYLGPKVFKPDNKILKLEYYHKTKAFFDKHGGNAMIFSRFLPVIRTVAPFVAGISKMQFGQFSINNFVGGVAWITLFLSLGYFFGNIPIIKDHFTIVVLVIIVVSVLPAIYSAMKTSKK